MANKFENGRRQKLWFTLVESVLPEGRQRGTGKESCRKIDGVESGLSLG
jgi:hypothetical protein